jgi:dihydroorotate dehydrogenase electron transfer subunit
LQNHGDLEHRPRIVRIRDVKEETPTVKSIDFRDDQCSKGKPGQFVMIWIPGIDEVPMSLSLIGRDGTSGVTVRKRGEATNALCAKKAGDQIGVRGPYGTHFTVGEEAKLLLAGGGTGIAALAPLIELPIMRKKDLTIVIGARTRAELIYLNRFKALRPVKTMRLVATTDDGSYGVKGFASSIVDTLLQKEKFDMIYACGPELMMKTILDSANRTGTPVQFSLERIFKCGVGICGSCSLSQYRVCRDGPVFSGDMLKGISEFGKARRDYAGRIVPI